MSLILFSLSFLVLSFFPSLGFPFWDYPECGLDFLPSSNHDLVAVTPMASVATFFFGECKAEFAFRVCLWSNGEWIFSGRCRGNGGLFHYQQLFLPTLVYVLISYPR